MAGLVEQLDAQIANLLAGWNSTSTLLLLAIGGFIAWVIVDTQDPDTHPLLLARQAQASYVRQPGESAIYRSPETPHGYPLKTGLAVKPPGAPLYSAGRDGDLRDIWKRVTGEIPLDKNNAGSTGKIMTVFGKEDITEHQIADITKEIGVIGQHLQDHKARKVAVYLPNSIELLAAVFAGAFYGFSPVLIPYNQPHATLTKLLVQTGADALIAEAGSLPLADVSKSAPGLRSVIWMVEKTSRHMDWNEVPEGIGGKVDVSVWHELVQEAKSNVVLPQSEAKAPSIIFLWQDGPGKDAEVVEFTQQNISAAVGAIISALPQSQRINSSDTFLPADVLTASYPLCLTLAALFSHATVVLNSVAGPGVDVSLSARLVAPTIIVVSAESGSKLHSTTASTATGAVQKLAHYNESRLLAAGRMPTNTILTPSRAEIGNTPGKLRLLYVSERAGHSCPPLTSEELSDLRVFTNARVIYALTAAKVAGAVAQTNIYDYRGTGGRGHFGVPLSSVEVKLKDTPTLKTSDDGAQGEIIVSGPAVAGGGTSLGINGTFRDDHTLAYI